MATAAPGSGRTQAISRAGGVILAAIVARQRLSFSYNGRRRVVEPQCLGLSTTQAETLRGYQLSGGAVSEPLFTVSKMSDLAVLPERFSSPGPNYKKGDSAMTIIFAEL